MSLPNISKLKPGFLGKIKQFCCYSLRELTDSNYAPKIDFDVYMEKAGMHLQRGDVWDLRQKQELIKSIIYDRSIMPLSILQYHPNSEMNSEKIWKIIDGKQRLKAALGFVKDEFPIFVFGKEYLFSELPDDWKSQIMRFRFNGNFIYTYPDDNLSDKQMVQWFHYVNFSGTPQEDVHMATLFESIKYT